VKAVRIHKTGGPEVLAFEDIDLPAPGPDQIRIRHTAIGLNFIDTYHRSGLYKLPLPAGLGSEAAGIVEAVGENVRTLKKGDRAAYCMVVGAYAEEANVPAARAVKLPGDISDEAAAAGLLKGLTAQYLLKATYKVKPGETILVHSAAGGVGLLLCQWAKHLGAIVIGTAGSEEKMKLAREHGAAYTLSSRADDIAARVRALTGGDGVPVVYDSVGKDSFAASLDCLSPRGLLICFGNSSGPVPAFDLGILNTKGSLYLTRPSLAHYMRTADETAERATDLFSMVSQGIVKIPVHQRFALRDVKKAHEALESRATTGATVLIP